jgi:hypothetical protein
MVSKPSLYDPRWLALNSALRRGTFSFTGRRGRALRAEPGNRRSPPRLPEGGKAVPRIQGRERWRSELVVVLGVKRRWQLVVGLRFRQFERRLVEVTTRMAAPATGQVTLAAGAKTLSSAQVNCVAFTIKAPATNAKTAYYGASTVTTSTGMALDPGESVTYQRNFQNGNPAYPLGPSDIYVCGTSGDVLTWFASPATS